MPDVYAIYGTGGYAREVMPILLTSRTKKLPNKHDKLFFIDDFEKNNWNQWNKRYYIWKINRDLIILKFTFVLPLLIIK